MEEYGMPELSERNLREPEAGMSEFSLAELMSIEDSSTTMTCWQEKVNVDDQWGLDSPTTRPGGCSPYAGFEILEKSKSTQSGPRNLHRAGRRVFSCFRHSTINLTVVDLEPNTPPPNRSGPTTAPRTSVGGANSFNAFMDEAIDHHHHTDNDEDLELEEPTSPVVNCIGQVRPKKPQKKHPKKIESPRDMDGIEKFRRTKSQAPMSPPTVAKSKSCKWKQLMRSSSSASISPSNHPPCESEPDLIDLGRFSSASCSDQPFLHPVAGASHADKLPDKTCRIMRRNSGRGFTPSDHVAQESDNTLKLLQQQLDVARPCSDNVAGEQERTMAESELVFRKLSSLKTMKTVKIESPKWIADEPLRNRRLGELNLSRVISWRNMNIGKHSSPRNGYISTEEQPSSTTR